MTMDLHEYQLVPIFLVSLVVVLGAIELGRLLGGLPWRARFSVYWH